MQSVAFSERPVAEHFQKTSCSTAVNSENKFWVAVRWCWRRKEEILLHATGKYFVVPGFYRTGCLVWWCFVVCLFLS